MLLENGGMLLPEGVDESELSTVYENEEAEGESVRAIERNLEKK